MYKHKDNLVNLVTLLFLKSAFNICITYTMKLLGTYRQNVIFSAIKFVVGTKKRTKVIVSRKEQLNVYTLYFIL